MASLKNLFFSLTHHLPRTLSSSCSLSKPRTHILLIVSLLLSLIIFSASQTSHSRPAILASTVASRLLFAATSFISPFSSVSPSNTCLVLDSESNCTLSSIAAIERTTTPDRERPRKDHVDDDDQESYDMVNNLSSCDIFDGNWVVDDDSDPLYPHGSCPFIDDAFNCHKNGRPDSDYLRYKWRPHGCQIPRFDGKKMLEMLRGKRLVFVGDSLNRNMWESLVCALRESLKDKSRLYEVSGRRQFRTQGFFSFKFRDYKCSIDFIKSPFLVQEWKILDKAGSRRETLRLDMIQGSSSKYYDADIIIFNTGHWWTHHKTFKGNNYFQEGSHVYNRLEVTEAYMKALRTWAQWVDENVDSNRTRVFFRGYSASHFRKGQWSNGGYCHEETKPITNDSSIAPYPWMMRILESVIAEMKTPVFYLNITKMTDYRQDGHPSIYRKPDIRRSPGMIQDCSHWCLPGVPDSWNQLLYATLLISHT
ncbi:hypothetical protein ACOSP7_007216 [Xanthoceras sorbifolium]|uniref:Trichome birefringence-like N-terminal domain-containing protein n=1 Tax=Xanthoceras sorbifolium TaxID=99658 RepID=A0ABQ8GX61_9ROSI|nr:hypothetical protein JRO89_XSUnG0204200 [Xanthoceras sorbifolium]